VKQTTKKVKLAVYDKDLKARIYRKFQVTDDGSKIQVKRGGKANFNPGFDNDSFIEFPKRRFIPPWAIKWDRVYFVPNLAKKCVNFRTQTVLEPDPSLVLKAAGTEMLKNLGKEKTETPLFTYITLGILILIALKLFGVIA
jgi:hypothetical protein